MQLLPLMMPHHGAALRPSHISAAAGHLLDLCSCMSVGDRQERDPQRADRAAADVSAVQDLGSRRRPAIGAPAQALRTPHCATCNAGPGCWHCCLLSTCWTWSCSKVAMLVPSRCRLVGHAAFVSVPCLAVISPAQPKPCPPRCRGPRWAAPPISSRSRAHHPRHLRHPQAAHRRRSRPSRGQHLRKRDLADDNAHVGSVSRWTWAWRRALLPPEL